MNSLSRPPLDTTTICTPPTFQPVWRPWWTRCQTARTFWWISWFPLCLNYHPSRSPRRNNTKRPWWDRWGRIFILCLKVEQALCKGVSLGFKEKQYYLFLVAFMALRGQSMVTLLFSFHLCDCHVWTIRSLCAIKAKVEGMSLLVEVHFDCLLSLIVRKWLWIHCFVGARSETPEWCRCQTVCGNSTKKKAIEKHEGNSPLWGDSLCHIFSGLQQGDLSRYTDSGSFSF